MIEFAGVKLEIDHRHEPLRNFVDDHIPLSETPLFGCPVALADDHASSPFSHNDPAGVGFSGSTTSFETGVGISHSSGGLPVPNYPPPPPLRFNTLYWPTGALRWSRALLIANTAQKDEIVEEVTVRDTSVSAQLKMAPADISGTIPDDMFYRDSENRWALSTAMHLLPPRPVTAVNLPFAPEPADRVWLLPLVDIRWFWQYYHTPNDFAPNLWPNVITELATVLGVTIIHSATGIAAAPDPIGFCRPFENAALVLDAAAHTLGHRFVRNIDGTTEMLRASESDAIFKDNMDLTDFQPWMQRAGGDFSDETTAGMVPEFVVVVFNAYTVTGTYSVEKNAVDYGHTQYMSGRSSSGGYLGGTTKIVHVSGYADEPIVPGDINDQLADQIAAQYYGHAGKNYDFRFNGIKRWRFSGHDDCAEFFMGSRQREDASAAGTRIQSSSYNFGVSEAMYQSTALRCAHGENIEGFLISDLEPAASCGTTPGTSTMDVWRGRGSNWASTGAVIPVRTRDEQIGDTIAKDTYVMAKCIDGNYVVDYASCAPCEVDY